MAPARKKSKYTNKRRTAVARVKPRVYSNLADRSIKMTRIDESIQTYEITANSTTGNFEGSITYMFKLSNLINWDTDFKNIYEVFRINKVEVTFFANGPQPNQVHATVFKGVFDKNTYPTQPNVNSDFLRRENVLSWNLNEGGARKVTLIPSPLQAVWNGSAAANVGMLVGKNQWFNCLGGENTQFYGYRTMIIGGAAAKIPIRVQVKYFLEFKGTA